MLAAAAAATAGLGPSAAATVFSRWGRPGVAIAALATCLPLVLSLRWSRERRMALLLYCVALEAAVIGALAYGRSWFVGSREIDALRAVMLSRYGLVPIAVLYLALAIALDA